MEMKATSEIVVNLGLDKNGRVQKYVTNTCARYMDKYVPYGQGLLRKTILLNEPDAVTYVQKYAHYLYKGILYVDPETGSSFAKYGVTKVPTDRQLKYHTAGTGSYWDKKMMSAEGDKMISEVQKYIDRGGK